MDQLPPLGTEITGQIAPTRRVYTPLLHANAEAISSTPRQTYQYGEHERLQLDVYEPAGGAKSDAPIVVFLYGGGYFNGEKILSTIPGGLVYANIGHFFAERGFVTVIPDYRLISHGAAYPSGGHDLAEAIEWIKANLGGSNKRSLFIMGNSAGGGHVATYLLDPRFRDDRSSISPSASPSIVLRGAIFVSTVFECDYFSTAVCYYGSNFEQKSPVGLLKRFGKSGETLDEVNVVVITSELDPDDYVKHPTKEFLKLWKSKNPAPLHHHHIKGHNHISTALALGTNVEREEAWGRDLVSLLKSFE